MMPFRYFSESDGYEGNIEYDNINKQYEVNETKQSGSFNTIFTSVPSLAALEDSLLLLLHIHSPCPDLPPSVA